MSAGRVVEEGSHDELIAAGRVYADMWQVCPCFWLICNLLDTRVPYYFPNFLEPNYLFIKKPSPIMFIYRAHVQGFL